MKLKTVHYVNTYIETSLKLERIKQEKGRRNVFTHTLKAGSEVQLDIEFNLDESTTVVRIDQDRTTEICTSRPNMLTKYLIKVLQLKHQEATKSQNWQGKFLSTVSNDEDPRGYFENFLRGCSNFWISMTTRFRKFGRKRHPVHISNFGG